MLQNRESLILIGYSGHGYVTAAAVYSGGDKLIGYCDAEEKKENPFNLKYLGSENAEKSREYLEQYAYVIGIGNNRLREKIYGNLAKRGYADFAYAVHKSAIIAPQVSLTKGSLFAAGSIVNPFAETGIGVICNTGSIIEHECKIGNFAHIAPGAVLAGNVTVGDRTFVGANAVIKQGITVGKDVTIGAGAVIIRDIPDGATVVGNPGKIIKHL